MQTLQPQELKQLSSAEVSLLINAQIPEVVGSCVQYATLKTVEAVVHISFFF